MELDMGFQIPARAHGHLYPIGPTKMVSQSHLHRFVFLPRGPKFTVPTYFFTFLFNPTDYLHNCDYYYYYYFKTCFHVPKVIHMCDVEALISSLS